ncbi:MAG: hypothetical protein U0174_20755 [Polyangiaceae bacterium]
MKLSLIASRTPVLSFSSALFVTLSVAMGACGGTPQAGPKVNEPTVQGTTSGASVSAVPPQTTVFEVSADEAVAAGPTPPGHVPAVVVERYRIEGAGGDKFVVVPIMSDGSRRGGVPVATAEVTRLVAVATKHKAALHCIEGASRAPYLTRQLKASGPVSIDVQSDCQGTYPSTQGAPAEYKQFRAGYEALRDALVAVTQSATAQPSK